MGFTFGTAFRIHVFGESHGQCIGVCIEGCPPGYPLSQEAIQTELDRRRPGTSAFVSQRSEPDRVEIRSGVMNGRTTGGPILMEIQNYDVDSSDYESIKNYPRPGHADYTAYVKYRGFNDPRGGGFFSGRLTAAYVMAGAVARGILSSRGIVVMAHTVQVGNARVEREISDEEILRYTYTNPLRCADPDAAQRMEQEILSAMSNADSVGGVVECRVNNVPVGIGEPLFDSVESCISHAMFSIPAIKGIEFGAGFRVASMRGSENNDEMTVRDGAIHWTKNDAGGILGGISNGAPIVFRVAVKPTPSIGRTQRTVDMATMQPEVIAIQGRQDPCIVPRVVPVVEAMTSVTILDLSIRGRFTDTE